MWCYFRLRHYIISITVSCQRVGDTMTFLEFPPDFDISVRTEETSASTCPIHRMDSYRSSSERLEAAAAHYRSAGAIPPMAAPRHVHQPPGAPPRQRGPSSSHAASRSNSGSEVYERMPSGGGGGGTGNGQAHRGHLEVSDDDSEYNSSMDRRGDRLVKPSQIKKNRSQGENEIHNQTKKRSFNSAFGRNQSTRREGKKCLHGNKEGGRQPISLSPSSKTGFFQICSSATLQCRFFASVLRWSS